VGLFSRRNGSAISEIDADERVNDVSVDLAYELQSKMFDQLATVSVAGAGLAVTLIGSMLRDAPRDVWLSVVFFGLAAITAVGGNQKLIEGLSKRQPSMQRSRMSIQITMALVGMATGWLSMSVYSDAKRSQPPSEVAATPRI
jgi:membrane associated rhomboid family serine protease